MTREDFVKGRIALCFAFVISSMLVDFLLDRRFDHLETNPEHLETNFESLGSYVNFLESRIVDLEI